MFKKKENIILLILGGLILASVKAGAETINNPYASDKSRRIFLQALKRGASEWLARAFVAWSKLETGNYTSHFVPDYNAYFGYSYDPNSKYQISAGSLADNGQPIAAYRNLEDSVNEVYDWLQRRYKRQDRGYFPNPNNITNLDDFAKYLKQANYYGPTAQVYASILKSKFDNLS